MGKPRENRAQSRYGIEQPGRDVLSPNAMAVKANFCRVNKKENV